MTTLGKILCGKMEGANNPAQTGYSASPRPLSVRQRFCADFLDEAACTDLIIEILHGQAPVCPSCRHEVAGPRLQAYRQGRRIRCDSCGKFFSVLSDTCFSGTHMNFREIVLLILLVSLNLPDRTVAALTRQNQETVRLWRKKLSVLDKIGLVTISQ